LIEKNKKKILLYKAQDITDCAQEGLSTICLQCRGNRWAKKCV